MGSVRAIAHRALWVIWKAELNRGAWPTRWAESWKQQRQDGLKPYDRTIRSFPRSDGEQCGVLCDITGGRRGTLKPVAKYVTKPTYILLDYVKTQGDLGQHLEGELSRTYTASVCWSCVALFDRLVSELP